MAQEITPRFKPGQTLTAYAAAADIEAGRFVVPTAAFNSDGDLPCGHAGAGDLALGVSQGRAEQSYAQHAQERRCPVNTGGVPRVETGAAFAALAPIASDASGRAVAAAAGDEILGTALEASTGAGEFAAIQFHPRGLAV